MNYRSPLQGSDEYSYSPNPKLHLGKLQNAPSALIQFLPRLMSLRKAIKFFFNHNGHRDFHGGSKGTIPIPSIKFYSAIHFCQSKNLY